MPYDGDKPRDCCVLKNQSHSRVDFIDWLDEAATAADNALAAASFINNTL